MYTDMGPYAYGTVLCPIRVWDVPCTYGLIYAYEAEQIYCIRGNFCGTKFLIYAVS